MPRNIPSAAQIAKLPVWAQDYIKHLESERESAVEQLLKFNDEQTETGVFIQDHVCIGEGTSGRTTEQEKRGSPTFVRRYLQTNRVQFKLPRDEMEMEVFVNAPEHRVEIRTPRGYPLIEIAGGNHFYITPKEDIYLRPNAVTLCQAACEAGAMKDADFEKKYGFTRRQLQAKMKEVVPVSHWNRTVRG